MDNGHHAKKACNEGAFGIIGTVAGGLLVLSVLASQHVSTPSGDWLDEATSRAAKTWLQPAQR